MNKILASLLALWLSFVPALAQQSVVVPATMFSIPITGTTGTTALLVTGIAGKSIYVTGVTIIPTAGTVQFIQGTGVTCGTGTTNVTGALVFGASQFLVKGGGNGAFWALLPGNSLCIVVGAGTAPGSLSFSQF